jgi:excisionase family DNA binding protein
MDASDISDLLTTEEVAERFRVNASTVRRWRLDGVGPRHVRIGSVYRYPRALLDEWIRANVAQTGPSRAEVSA